MALASIYPAVPMFSYFSDLSSAIVHAVKYDVRRKSGSRKCRVRLHPKIRGRHKFHFVIHNTHLKHFWLKRAWFQTKAFEMVVGELPPHWGLHFFAGNTVFTKPVLGRHVWNLVDTNRLNLELTKGRTTLYCVLLTSLAKTIQVAKHCQGDVPLKQVYPQV